MRASFSCPSTTRKKHPMKMMLRQIFDSILVKPGRGGVGGSDELAQGVANLPAAPNPSARSRREALGRVNERRAIQNAVANHVQPLMLAGQQVPQPVDLDRERHRLVLGDLHER